MSFHLKNSIDEVVFSDEFSQRDFEIENFRAESFHVALPFGTMTAKQWFFDGIKMSYSESVTDRPVELDWKGDTEMITMQFNLQGKISIVDTSMPKAFELSGNQHNMFYGQRAEGKIKVDELQSKSFLIQLSKKSFLDIANDGNDAIKRFADVVESGRSHCLILI